MTKRFPAWPLWLAAGLNLGLTLVACALVALAPDRAATAIAAGGIVFFGLATAAFATMLRLRAAPSTTSRDAATERRPR